MKAIFLLLIAQVLTFNRVYSYKGSFKKSLYDVIIDFEKIYQNTNPSNFQSNIEKITEAFKVNPSVAITQSIVNLFRRDKQSALTFDQLCQFYGYQCDLHFVTTDDGYILQLYSLYNQNVTSLKSKPEPFLLIHGLFLSSIQWIFNGKNQSTAFELADKGFIVWAINDRGTTYSLNHTRFDPYTDNQFWDFTFTDMARFDLPATVKYIQNATGYKKIQVLGYSQGTLVLTIALSIDPSYSENFDLIYLVSPVPYLGNIKGLANIIPRNEPFVNAVGSIRAPISPARSILASLSTLLCSLTITQPICIEIVNGAQGFDTEQINLDLVGSSLSQVDQTSFKNLAHFLQSINRDHVSEYDYGKVANMEKYNSKEPPVFKYRNIPTERLVILSGLNDYLATEKNDQKFRNSLNGPPLEDIIITDPLASHLDVSIARQAKFYYNDVIYDIYLRHGNNKMV